MIKSFSNQLFDTATPFAKLMSAFVICLLVMACGSQETRARKELAKLNKEFSPDSFLQSIHDGDKFAVKLFLDAGIPVDTAHENGITGLGLAAAKGYIELMELLLSRKADVNARARDGSTPLVIAASFEQVQAASLLCKKGADAKAKNNNGTSPLHIAANKGLKDLSKELIELGAEVDVTDNLGMTPLMLATDKGHFDVVKLLLSKKADPNAKSKEGETALDFALLADHGKPEVIAPLRAAGGKFSKFAINEVEKLSEDIKQSLHRDTFSSKEVSYSKTKELVRRRFELFKKAEFSEQQMDIARTAVTKAVDEGGGLLAQSLFSRGTPDAKQAEEEFLKVRKELVDFVATW